MINQDIPLGAYKLTSRSRSISLKSSIAHDSRDSERHCIPIYIYSLLLIVETIAISRAGREALSTAASWAPKLIIRLLCGNRLRQPLRASVNPDAGRKELEGTLINAKLRPTSLCIYIYVESSRHIALICQ